MLVSHAQGVQISGPLRLVQLSLVGQLLDLFLHLLVFLPVVILYLLELLLIGRLPHRDVFLLHALNIL